MRFTHYMRLLDNSAYEYEKYVRRCYAHESMPYVNWISEIAKLRNAEQKATQVCLAKILNYESISEREVIEIYPSTSEPDTTIIIVTGDEQGKAWTTEEYNKVMERYKRKELPDESIESQ